MHRAEKGNLVSVIKSLDLRAKTTQGKNVEGRNIVYARAKIKAD